MSNREAEDDSEGSDILADMLAQSSISNAAAAAKADSKFGMSGMLEWEEADGGEANFTTMVVDDNRFTGKVIVVTGAGGQLGREGCRYFAKRGARVAAIDRSKAGLKETFNALNQDRTSTKRTFDFKPYVCDVTDPKAMAEVADSVFYRFGRIDYLWNNAGYQGKIKTILDNDPEDFALVMSINVTGMFIVLQCFARKMKEQGGNAAIVNTGSVAGQRGTPGMVGYAASKAAVHAMTVCAAKELAQYNIRVNTVSPALIGPGFLWERQNKLHAKIGEPFFSSDAEEVGTAKINSVPMKRLGTPEEVVETVCFLFSKEASYITGVNVNVDGGMNAGMKG
jgi:NAD(P)-dependent dehydrogenase (short-subunit alcohol dehydrogenase family)